MYNIFGHIPHSHIYIYILYVFLYISLLARCAAPSLDVSIYERKGETSTHCLRSHLLLFSQRCAEASPYMCVRVSAARGPP